SLNQIQEIFFFFIAIKNFPTDEKKMFFYQKWLGCYLDHPKESFLFLASDKENNILGYCVGVFNSASAAKWIAPSTSAPYYLFQDLFQEFPCHIHINVHPNTRGTGLGSQMIEKVKDFLFEKKIYGLHIITSPGVQNVEFYRKNNFIKEVTRQYGATSLHFMGCHL
ncbi:MAG: GNAT family N-acetyltransferase, partial [Bdellovibrionales bacterium]|nr:GNAT family N-acetyltransferase [Bdellovibrionales bacterium]